MFQDRQHSKGLGRSYDRQPSTVMTLKNELFDVSQRTQMSGHDTAHFACHQLHYTKLNNQFLGDGSPQSANCARALDPNIAPTITQRNAAKKTVYAPRAEVNEACRKIVNRTFFGLRVGLPGPFSTNGAMQAW